MNTALHSESRKINYYSWDKYSWFLYISDKYEEALVANENAQKAVKICIEKYNDESAKKYSELINQHEKNIINQDWRPLIHNQIRYMFKLSILNKVFTA